jgi:hypothetical protein
VSNLDELFDGKEIDLIVSLVLWNGNPLDIKSIRNLGSEDP